nr:hypothetical protein [Vibrio parahaemolyticus]
MAFSIYVGFSGYGTVR